MVSLIIKLSLMKVFNCLKKTFTYFKTNEYNYVDIQKCHGEITDDSYLIYIKDLSILDKITIILKGNNETISFFNGKTLNINDIIMNNTFKVEVPNGLKDYSIIIKYSLNLLNSWKKEFKPQERINSYTIGENKKYITYKIVEK